MGEKSIHQSIVTLGKGSEGKIFFTEQPLYLEGMTEKPSFCSHLCNSHGPGASRNTKIRLPWWYTGQESTCQCEGHQLSPWSRKIPPATEQLSPGATTVCPRGCALQPEKPPKWAALDTNERVSPHSLQPEKAQTATETQCNQKQKQALKKNAKATVWKAMREPNIHTV